MGTIDRIRYYDGEFLRASDFNDEQSYHVEMRRRINRYLHLNGIVQGLQLSANTEAGVTQVSIQPGMAVDAYGREIYVFQPYMLGDADITNNRITYAGNYDVWLRYQKSSSTPPSSGYSSCNQTNQYTRWAESYSVVLLKNPSHPFTIPGFAIDDEDDPSQDQVGVLLGTVAVTPGTNSEFATTTLTEPHFVGIIAQRIHTPFPYDARPSFQFKNKQSPRNPAASLEIEPNIFARQNLILGPDFDLTQTASGTSITPNPAFGTGPGSAKIAGDLVVQGTIYSLIPGVGGAAPQWLGLSAYVQQLVKQNLPDIAVGTTGTVTVTNGIFNGGSGGLSGSFTGTSTASVTMSRLTQYSSQQVIAYFSQIESATMQDLGKSFHPGDQIELQIIGQPTFQFDPGGGTSGKVSVSWEAQPAVSGPNKCAVDNFSVTCVVILFP